ncbi:serine/threonine-protein kinase-like protein At1g28390 [Benincasa hispida]|uniref:serine/threonine-protein kinase-like protein At1g28390 n=1 Tax=Benincasa hispida TaxID=102211 RepID=UPI0018FFAA3E|nr:serine/threonine-protein kinase-like protein At1g28390 [Benincasa hispida]
MDFFSTCTSDSAIPICGCDLKIKPKNPFQIRNFSYSDLLSSTHSFSSDCFLGKGSHGTVYKAVLDGGKLIVAVKRTKFTNPSPNFHYNSSNPAENEIEILSRLRNPRIVNLIGFCANSKDEKLLVVEFMPNGSLYDLLHSQSRPPGWTRRLQFALQVAKAVRALHTSNPPVIHRDIKSSNVLIDGNFNARLGDFGLALRGHVEDVRVRCTPPAGTLGYLDPGYLAPADLSVKSDVFSFGILLLEILSGRNAIDVHHSPPSVVDWALPMIKHGDFDGLCDPRIGSPTNSAVIRCMAVLAAKCVRSTVQKRPDMVEVVECLKAVKKKLHVPPIWNNLRRRERHVENLQPLISNFDEPDGSDEPVRVCRIGSRRNRKVSSVSSTEYGIKTIGRVVRSRSMGSVNDVKLGQINSNVGGSYYSSLGGRRKYSGVAVKIPTMTLSKSRSVGVSENPKFVEFNRRAASFLPEIEMSKLTIGCDGKSENQMLEKPLFQK